MTVIGRPVLWALSAAALAILLSLGTWQVKRLAWKTDLIAQVEARVDAEPIALENVDLTKLVRGEFEYQPVAVSGGFPSAKTAHVFGTFDSVPGFYAFQAMRLDDGTGRLILVNRGFVPQDQRQDYYPLPSAERLTGLARFYNAPTGIAAAVAASDQPGEGTFYSRTPEVLQSYLAPGEEDSFLPFAVDSTLPTELPQGGTTRLEFRNAHLGYALTWFGLAAGLVGVVGALSLRKKP
ncbi:MAG: SURF1 family protein [Parvularculaceae bacterium]|nr:SURF1 family protein [Parvularculaceae bacterium]